MISLCKLSDEVAKSIKGRLVALLKKTIGTLLKIALATGLVSWLVVTKKITLEPFRLLVGVPWLIPFFLTVTFILIVVNNYRWLLLLQGQRIKTGMRQTLPLTFIGLFFNMAMPGSVGGDVIKAYFIVQEHPGTKLRAATSVLMDRIVGLYAMALIALFAVIVNVEKIKNIPNLRGLAFFILFLVFSFTIFFVIGFSSRVRSHKATHQILGRIPLGRLIEKIYDAIHAFRSGKIQFLAGIALSVFVQISSILSFFVLANALHYQNLSLSSFFFIIPLGLIATAIPISPAGIGVGQAVFLALFTWYQGSESTLGPTLITISQVSQASLGVIGAILYMLRKSPSSHKSPELESVRSG